MTWVRLEDQSWSHPKVVSAGNAAWGLLVRLCAYSAAHRLDGFVPSIILDQLGTPTEIERLKRVGLLDQPRALFLRQKRFSGDSRALEIHDFLVWNPSAKELRDLGKERSAAGLRGAESRWGKHGKGHSEGDGKPHGKKIARARAIPSRPVPSRSERENAPSAKAPSGPSHPSTSSGSRRTLPIAGRSLVGENLAYANEAGFDSTEARDVWEKFYDYAEAKAWSFTNAGWSRRWRKWIDEERDKPKNKRNGFVRSKEKRPHHDPEALPVGSPKVGDLIGGALKALEGK